MNEQRKTWCGDGGQVAVPVVEKVHRTFGVVVVEKGVTCACTVTY